jgi:hypothetical protein
LIKYLVGLGFGLQVCPQNRLLISIKIAGSKLTVFFCVLEINMDKTDNIPPPGLCTDISVSSVYEAWNLLLYVFHITLLS